eukprot:4417296-Alexandrium_andersonii.AAC.1
MAKEVFGQVAEGFSSAPESAKYSLVLGPSSEEVSPSPSPMILPLDLKVPCFARRLQDLPAFKQ